MSVLEPAVAEFARAAAAGPPLSSLTPEEAREELEDLQSGPTPRPEVDSAWLDVRTAETHVRIRMVRPVGTTRALLPVVLYLHGGGWVLGSADTHDRLVRELAVGLGAAVAFVAYDRSPDVRYPVALDQAHAAALWIHEHGTEVGVDARRMAVAGDSAGGNLAAALAITVSREGGVSFVQQSLYYPVTDAGQATDSYREFADGPHLTADSMAWFWDAYLPDRERRLEVTASPLQAGPGELSGLPETFVLVSEYDVLRDEGEAYARRLTAAGVRCSSVRYNGAVHDFMMLDPLRETAAASSAVRQAVDVLSGALHP